MNDLSVLNDFSEALAIETCRARGSIVITSLTGSLLLSSDSYSSTEKLRCDRFGLLFRRETSSFSVAGLYADLESSIRRFLDESLIFIAKFCLSTTSAKDI